MNSGDNQASLRILITGGSSGIGEAVALEMAKDKHSFYLTGRNEQNLKNICENLTSMGCKAFYGVGEVSDEQTVVNMFEDIKTKLGGIDVVFANAGVGYFGNLEDLTIEQYVDRFQCQKCNPTKGRKKKK